MGERSKIEWTEATWNPLVGCSVLSPGCTNCYAMKMADRIQRMSPKQTHYAGTTKPSKAGPVWTGKLAQAPDNVLLKPLRWKRPRTIFVNSMSDLFHENVPDEWIDLIFAVMALAKQHTFQVLTKRAERMRDYFDDVHGRAMAIGCALGDMLDGDWIWGEGKQFRSEIEGMISLAHGMAPDGVNWAKDEFLPLPNVWLGVSAEDQKRADERIPHLLETPAAVRFVSAEPLLGPLDLTHIDLPGGDEEIFPLGWPAGRDDEPRHPFLDWVIVGGESGPGARPMHPDWARSIRDHCHAADVPFFMKQWGRWGPVCGAYGYAEAGSLRSLTCVSSTERRNVGKQSWLAGRGDELPAESLAAVGKRARLLDGREHNEMPEKVNG